jgi:chemotaxis protein CheX
LSQATTSSQQAQDPPAEAVLRLAAALDLNAAAPLAAELLARRGQPLALDGAHVARIGGQCLQVLLAARATWAADGRPFSLIEPSSDLLDALTLLGAADLCSHPSLEPRL